MRSDGITKVPNGDANSFQGRVTSSKSPQKNFRFVESVSLSASVGRPDFANTGYFVEFDFKNMGQAEEHTQLYFSSKEY